MLNTIGSLCGAEASGVLDCVTYTAGVSGKFCPRTCRVILTCYCSGSCWALGVMHSGVAGSSSAFDAALHLKDRIQTSYLDMSTLDALVAPLTNQVRNHSCISRRRYLSPIFVIQYLLVS